MKSIVISIAIALIVLGMIAISNSFTEPAPGKGDQGMIITEQRQETSPLAFGLAIMAGGVLLLVIAVRRRSA